MMRMVVTGASSGIGNAIWNHYRDVGHQVVGVSRHGPDVKVDLQHMELSGWQDIFRHSYQVDPNVLILNAGVMLVPEPSPSTDPCRSWDECLFELNFRSSWEILDWITTGAIHNPECVILIASTAGMSTADDVPFYGAMKAALLSLMRSYAKKLAHRGTRVNSISPGFFDTNLVPGKAPSELLCDIPLNREGDPKELIPVVDAIMNCPYMVGTNIVVDGGELL